MFWTTAGSITTVAPAGGTAAASSYTGTKSIPIGLLPGLSEMYGGFIIGSHQYLTLRGWPTSAACSGAVPIAMPVSSCEADGTVDAAAPSTFSGVRSMWQIGHVPGW